MMLRPRQSILALAAMLAALGTPSAWGQGKGEKDVIVSPGGLEQIVLINETLANAWKELDLPSTILITTLPFQEGLYKYCAYKGCVIPTDKW